MTGQRPGDPAPQYPSQPAVLAPVLARLRRRLLARASDVTAPTASASALVLAPHPDDETLGCGAVILHKLAAGAPVTVVVFADGRHSHRSPALPPDRLRDLRHAEMQECARRLGLASANLRLLGLEDQTLERREDELAGTIWSLIEELKPTEVYVTGPFESHRDHAALGRAARRAVAARHDPPLLLEYPIWVWAQLWYGSDEPLGRRLWTVARAIGMVLGLRPAVVVRTDGFGEQKLHALAAHASQLQRPSGVPAGHPWPVLPPVLLDAAADPVEVFLPWRAGRLAVRVASRPRTTRGRSG